MEEALIASAAPEIVCPLKQGNQVEHTKTERNVLEHVNHPFIVSLHYAFQTPKKPLGSKCMQMPLSSLIRNDCQPQPSRS